MAIKLSDELLAKLQAEADEQGKVSFMGSGMLDMEKKELMVESIEDTPVEYAEEESMEEEPMEEGAEAAPNGEKEKPGMAIMMAFKKASGHK